MHTASLLEKMKQHKIDFSKKIFFLLVFILLVLGMLNIVKGMGFFIPQQPRPLVVDNVVTLESMSLEQKIAQMILASGSIYNLQAWKKMQLGGIHLFAMQNKELFQQTIQQYQEGMDIPFFVSADLEGCLNPFSAFRPSMSVSKIRTQGAAFEKGKSDGEFLNSLGFTINFAPVVDLRDEIWKCRAFPGNEEEIVELAEAYILGLQSEGIIATAKHYPGKTLVVKDPHKEIVAATIDSLDIAPYEQLNEIVQGVMISHLVVEGAVNSQGRPAVVAENIVHDLKNKYTGLVITDEIQMLGLRNFYRSLDEMYVDVFKANNDIILNFGEDPEEMQRMIKIVAEAVQQGEIPETRIDVSVRKILEAKGFVVE